MTLKKNLKKQVKNSAENGIFNFFKQQKGLKVIKYGKQICIKST